MRAAWPACAVAEPDRARSFWMLLVRLVAFSIMIGAVSATGSLVARDERLVWPGGAIILAISIPPHLYPRFGESLQRTGEWRQPFGFWHPVEVGQNRWVYGAPAAEWPVRETTGRSRMPEVVSSDGFRIACRSFGSGIAVLLLHPANATRRSWSDLGWIDALVSAGHRVITMDSRGFGDSDRVCGPVQLASGTSSLDIDAVMDALEIRTAHVCGFSLGAAQALRLVLDRPARVESLVLGGLAAGPLAQMGIHLSSGTGAARAEALRQMRRPLDKSSGEARAYFEAVRALLSSVSLRAIEPSKLRAPILGIAGAADPYDPQSLYRALLDDGAPIEVVIIPDLGHGSCFTHPSFRELAIQFVVTQAGRQTSDSC